MLVILQDNVHLISICYNLSSETKL